MKNYLSTFLWPLQSQAALESFASEKIVVIYTTHPEMLLRDASRQHLRLVVTELLIQAFHCTADQVRITSFIGEGLRVSVNEKELCVSMSYEAGISIAAITYAGKIGIDIMQVEPQTDWEDVARLYLGEQQTSQLLSAPKRDQATLFALYWTQLEAKLKCNGHALTEYSNQCCLTFINNQSNKNTYLYTLNVPVNYVASLALQTSSSIITPKI